MPLFAILLAILLFSPAALLADEPDSLAQEPEFESIALPGQSAYNGKGLTFGMGLGLFDPAQDCDCMGSWQVQLEFFYLDWLSAGGNVRFFGGDFDNDAMVVYQRFSLHFRMHTVLNSLDLYMGPVLGLETTDISEFREQVTGESERFKNSGFAQDTTNSQESCARTFSMDGFSAGLSFGGGFNVSRYFGLTTGFQLEYNFRNDVMFAFVPGIAFNLREVWPWTHRNLRSAWVSFEIGGQKYLTRHVETWSNTVFLGIVLGA